MWMSARSGSGDRNRRFARDVPPDECAEHPGRARINWDQIKGNWKQFTGKAKEKCGKLTDDDWTVISGKRDQLVGKLQERYGIARDEAERQVNDFERQYENV